MTHNAPLGPAPNDERDDGPRVSLSSSFFIPLTSIFLVPPPPGSQARTSATVVSSIHAINRCTGSEQMMRQNMSGVRTPSPHFPARHVSHGVNDRARPPTRRGTP